MLENPLAFVDPNDRGGTNKQFDVGAALAQQGSRFQRALAAADHSHPFVPKPAKVSMLRRMRSKRLGQTSKLLRDERKWSQPARDDHSPRQKPPTALEAKLETGSARLHTVHKVGIYVNGCLRLYPVAVCDEGFQWQGAGQRAVVLPLKLVKRQ